MSSLGFQLDRVGERPLVEQLRDGLAHAITSGELAVGARLPSTRQVAEEHDVHRQTVVEAFRRLVADGLIELRRGSGAYVSARAARPRPEAQRATSVGSRALRSFERRDATRAEIPEAGPGALDLAGLVPHERGYP